MQQLDGTRGDQRRLLGRLGDDRIAGDEGGCDLAGEYRQRKIPWRDAGDHAARACTVFGIGRLPGIIAQEIDRLAQLRYAVGQCLAGLAGAQREKLHRVLFVKVGRLDQHAGSYRHRRPLPAGLRLDRRLDGPGHINRTRLGNFANALVGLGGIAPGMRLATTRSAGQHRSGSPKMRRGERLSFSVDPRQRHRIGNVEPFGVAALRSKDARRRRDRRIGGGALRHDRLERIMHDILRLDGLVDDLMHEGRIGAVLEQAADQIRKQVGVRAHRGIDATARAFDLPHRLVQRFAHAVQPLEFKAFLVTRHCENRGDAVRVVGRELRIDAVSHAEQLLGAGDIGDVGVRLAREHRIACKPQHLRAFDLGVPVGPLDEPDHDAAIDAFGERVEPVDDKGGAGAIGLNHDPHSLPAGKPGIRQHPFDHIQRQIEPVGFLGIDVQADARVTRGKRQRQQALDNDRKHRFLLAHFITRVKRGQFYRDSMIAVAVFSGRGGAQRGDRIGIRAMIAQRVVLGARGLAEHVKGIKITFSREVASAPHRLVDAAAEHEMLAHFPHRRRHGRADHRLSEPPDHRAQRALDANLAIVEDAAGQHQRPGRRIDEDRARASRMRRPIVRRDLVVDQIVHGLRVGHPQQRLRKAHQRHAFLRRQAIFGEKHLQHLDIGPLAHRAHQIDRTHGDRGALLGRKAGEPGQALERPGLVGKRVGADFRADFFERG